MEDRFRALQNTIARHCAGIASIPDELPDLLEMLRTTDWLPLIQAQHQRLEEWEQREHAIMETEMAKRPAQCARCRNRVPVGTMTQLYDLTWSHKLFCESCANALQTELRPICIKCYEPFGIPYGRASLNICGMCRSKNTRLEKLRVAVQLQRAQEFGCEATLTLEQWTSALLHFQGMCAYCQKWPYEALEHFIPVTRGGGTTADNCVPICTTCNSRKGNLLPDEAIYLIGAEGIERARTYLASRDKQTDAPSDHLGLRLA